MSSTKKKRVSRKEGFRFTLMHRSQQDPLYHDEEHGSKFILHPADRKTAQAMERGALEQEGALNYVTDGGATAAKAIEHQTSRKRKQEYFGIKELREVDDYGLPIDGYDYSKHLSTIGGGAFIGADGIRIENAFPTARQIDEEDEEDDEVEISEGEEGEFGTSEERNVLEMIPGAAFASAVEQPRLLEAITLRPEGMDEDMKRQLGLLEDAEEASEGTEATGEWGDLQDDFMTQLIVGGAATAEDAEREQADEEGEDNDGAFDFEAHMQRLMKQAEMEDAEEEEEEEEEDEYDAFARRQRGGAAREGQVTDRPQRDVDEHFETVLAMEYEDDGDYDSDEQDLEGEDGLHQRGIEPEAADGEEGDDGVEDELGDQLGDLVRAPDDEDERELYERESHTTMRSKRSSRAQQARRKITQDDPVFLQAINEFLEFKASDSSLGVVANPPSAVETLRLIPKSDETGGLLNEHVTDAAPKGDGSSEEDEENDLDEEAQPSYEEFMEMWGTYKPTQKPQFDCQSIVSTRSTTDNIPSQIFIENGRAKKKQQQKQQQQKTAPIIVEEEEAEEDDVATVESVTREVARLALLSLTERSKKETPQERKARKAQLKELQRERRAQKKQTKELFKREKAEVINRMTAPGAPKPGVTEFKIN